MQDVQRLLKASIRFGLDNRDAALSYALTYGRDLNREKADQFVGMYVNDWTLDFGPDGQRAVTLFLERGYEAGIIPAPITPEFIDAAS